MAAAIPATSGWNGQSLALGPRVYVPNGNSDTVDCYDASTNASCLNFPKAMPNLGLLYTVNADPQRPTCLWVNSDDGSGQIQNFDAYTGSACGQGPIRVLASSFVVPTQLCQPASYTSLQVTSPAPGTYTTGTVSFQDGDANPLLVPDQTLDATGTAELSGLNLSTNVGLPQFLITLTGAQGTPGAVTVKLTWTGTDDPSCVEPGTTISGGGLNYVALGDSYSSGEGNPPFLKGTDTASDQCHRSSEAYTQDLADDPGLNITSYADRACSGATSGELEFGFPANHEDAQVSHISGSTNLITIGVGGDDVGFADVLNWCIVGLHTGASSDCQHMKVPDPNGSGTKITLTQRESILINKLGEDLLCETPNGWVDCQPSLQSIYEDIASRAAANARILVLLYPHLFTDAPAQNGCHLAGVGGIAARISKVNMVWINQGVDQLDSKIINEVQLAKKDGVNIDYVDPRPAWSDTDNNASPGGHGVCTKEPWMNGLILKGLGPSVYSFHPNIGGQFEFYAAIRAKLVS
jgi:hypothetical protein